MFPLETKICSKVSEKIRKFDKVMSWWHHYLLLLKKSLELSAIFKKKQLQIIPGHNWSPNRNKKISI